ncbi:PASTA domain-containing protein [Ruminococcus callidus]|nr:PASTA domain-containing protein [Ruminococcus callidus]
MAYYGLNYALVGASASSEGALVKSQSVPEGTQIQRGSSVTLTLSAGEATD